ncbi:hypothetical protein F2Q68_00016170 [Brassica cretica]|uniref:Uncharacterized protein n=1 Tax=Brassica cretica TaxID=69181 RepID=A0A8S9HDX6_BRACR|nr:hypothetical protein F2Q68_00016170 [Brassica cretica]
MKRIHDPVKFVVPYEVFEAESPIPPDKSMELSSYGGVFYDNKYVKASQRGLRFRDEVDNCPAEVPSSDINITKSIDTIISSSIDTGQIPSIDTLRESEQKEFEVCQNLFDGGTTMRSEKSGGKKWRNWKKKKRINEGSQISLIPHFSDDARKSRVRLHKYVAKKGRNWKKWKRTKGDVDKVTLKDFLELEEWLRQKLDDQPASGKGLEYSLKAVDIDRHKPDEIDRHPPYDIDLQSPSNIDQHTPDCIARYPPNCIDRYSWLDELSGYPIEPGPIEEIMHMPKTSHIDVPEHLRPPICAEETVGICKRVKRIHDPVKIMVPCEVFEVESPIPPDKGVYLSSYIEVLNDQHHVEASQRGLRFRDEVDEGPAEAPSSDISKSELIDTHTSSSIDTDQIPSIDTRRGLEQNEYELCGNIFYGDTTTHSDKSGGKKWRNWKKKKRINEGSQISLIPHFSDDARKSRVRLHKSVGKKGRNWKKQKRTKGGSQLPLTPYFSDSIRKSRVRSRCFSQPFAKLKALLIAEMIDKGEGYMEEAFRQER